MDLGSGHELSIHSDAVTIKLFRQIAIDEVYGVHWFTGDSPNPEGRVHRADSHRDSHSDETHSPQSKSLRRLVNTTMSRIGFYHARKMRGTIANLTSAPPVWLEHDDLLVAMWKLNSDMMMSCSGYAKAIACIKAVRV
jgi:hypothetical protein